MKNLKIIFLSLFCAAALVSCGTKPATYHRSTSSISPLDSIIEATTEIESSNIDESSVLDDTSFETIIKIDSIEDKEENKSCEASIKTDNSSIAVETTTAIVKNPKTTTSKIEINVPASDVEETSSWIVVEKPIEETTVITIDENSNTGIDDYSYQLLAEIVWHEAGMDTISLYDKAHIAAAVMNRVYDERFPNTVYENLIDQSQFPGFYIGTCIPTQECYDAVDYYLANPYEFDNSNSWYGTGFENIFYYQ